MKITVNGNPVEFQEGMAALQILQEAGFTSGHNLALITSDDTLIHLEDNQIVKPVPGDEFVAVPKAVKGRHLF